MKKYKTSLHSVILVLFATFTVKQAFKSTASRLTPYVQEEEVPVVVRVLSNGAHPSVGSWTDCRDGQQSGGGSDIEREVLLDYTRLV